MSDEINKEQKASEENEVKSDELADDILDDASGGAVFAKYDGVAGESLDKDHKPWINILSVGQDTSAPSTRDIPDDDIQIKR